MIYVELIKQNKDGKVVNKIEKKFKDEQYDESVNFYNTHKLNFDY